MTTGELTRIFGRIGLLSFGGPAAQIALMHKELVDDRDWLSEEQFLRALSFCMLLPGPEAMQLATYAGWRLRGTLGGLIAGLLFVLPGAVVIAVLALIYASYGNVPLVQALFLGVKATVVVIVIEALLKVSKRALKRSVHWIIAACAFIAIFAFNLPFPLIVICAGIAGALLGHTDVPTAEGVARPATGALKTIVIWGALWFAPLALIYAADPDFLGPLSVFFSKLAVVTFGGAYAVLAYMTQTVVGDFGWLTTPQMMDALGLAETTPGPLILVTEFVAILAGHQAGGWPLGLVAGAITLWMTFIPCFLWIFAGAPYIDWLSARPRLAAALNAVTAAVVGVILNLSLWFAFHVFFTNQIAYGPLVLPELSTLEWLPALIAAGAGYLLLVRHWGMVTVLGLAALSSMAIQILT